jgi:D-sedoheptulose 7-phosphate isomerase
VSVFEESQVVKGSAENKAADGSFSSSFLAKSCEIIAALNTDDIEALTRTLARSRDAGGRLFIIGVGGSAGHASHAVNDFRKLCGFEAYAPTDNVSELTARINDEGWSTTFSGWLKGSRIREGDALLIFSVGGGDREHGISTNIVEAIDLAKQVGAKVTGIVGRAGGYTAQRGDAVVIVPPRYSDLVTPMTEGVAAVVWHLLVSHPLLKANGTKWESTVR